MRTQSLLSGLGASLILTAPLAVAEDKPEFAEFAKLLQQTIAAQLPRQFEDRSQWGKTVPIPDNLKLTRLRTTIKVGDKEELPHGMWKRTKVWLDDPAKDLQIRVRDLRALDAQTTRLCVEATIALHGEREHKRWRKGLPLLGLTAQADATITITLDMDVTITLNGAKFPPELVVEPKVVKSQVDLKEFELLRVGKVLDGDKAREVGNEMKGLLQERLRQHETDIKDYANRAIAKSLKEGKGTISAAALLKANGK